MTSSPFAGSPLARLVLFMICLSVAGSISAGIHYLAADLPAQNAVPAPSNALEQWRAYYKSCLDGCFGSEGFIACEKNCDETAYALYCAGKDVCD